MLQPGVSNAAESSKSSEHKKQVHLKCEKVRREAIKVGYKELKAILPPEFSPASSKLTNASILYRAADYLKELKSIQRQQCDEISRLKSQVIALQIICQNYAQLSIVENKDLCLVNSNTSLRLKYEMFRSLLDHWFDSFEKSVQMDDYSQLANSMLQWFEQKMDFSVVQEIFDKISKDFEGDS